VSTRLALLRRGPLVLGLVALVAALIIWALRLPSAPSVSGQSLSGQVVQTAALRDRPYLVHFWATSCVTCVKEMPALVAFPQAFAEKGLETIAVAMSYDRREYVEQFVSERGLPFTMVHDLDGRWSEAYGRVGVTPTTFLIDREGRIAKRFVGEPDFEDLSRWLDRELSRKLS